MHTQLRNFFRPHAKLEGLKKSSDGDGRIKWCHAFASADTTPHNASKNAPVLGGKLGEAELRALLKQALCLGFFSGRGNAQMIIHKMAAFFGLITSKKNHWNNKMVPSLSNRGNDSPRCPKECPGGVPWPRTPCRRPGSWGPRARSTPRSPSACGGQVPGRESQNECKVFMEESR